MWETRSVSKRTMAGFEPLIGFFWLQHELEFGEKTRLQLKVHSALSICGESMTQIWHTYVEVRSISGQAAAPFPRLVDSGWVGKGLCMRATICLWWNLRISPAACPRWSTLPAVQNWRNDVFPAKVSNHLLGLYTMVGFRRRPMLERQRISDWTLDLEPQLV